MWYWNLCPSFNNCASRFQIKYYIPVDLTIDQFNPKSWRRVASAVLERAYEKDNPTAIIMQHEYGLSGKDATGDDYQNIAKKFNEKDIVTLVNLHTVLSQPNFHQKKVIRELSELVDGFIVPTKSAIKVLSSKTYGIDQSKLKNIDHGIRTEDISLIDQEEVKKKYKLEDVLLISTLGLRSIDKGIDYAIRGYGEMINNSFSPKSKEKKRIAYLVVGQYHPNFIEDSPNQYKKAQDKIKKALKETRLKSIIVDNPISLKRKDVENNDVIFLESFLTESLLREFYTASDIILLPYCNREQMSSGILADSIGFGKPIVTTKFPHARELLFSGNHLKKGIIGNDLTSRGILVDLKGKYKNEPDVKQIAEGLDFLVFNEKARVQIGINARKRGFEMKWDNVTFELVKHIGSILESKFAIKRTPIILKKDK